MRPSIVLVDPGMPVPEERPRFLHGGSHSSSGIMLMSDYFKPGRFFHISSEHRYGFRVLARRKQ